MVNGSKELKMVNFKEGDKVRIVYPHGSYLVPDVPNNSKQVLSRAYTTTMGEIIGYRLKGQEDRGYWPLEYFVLDERPRTGFSKFIKRIEDGERQFR